MWTYNYPTDLRHFGVLGMKWGVRKDKMSTPRADDVVIKKGTKMRRITNVENENITGHAFVSYKKEDMDRYMGYIGGQI